MPKRHQTRISRGKNLADCEKIARQNGWAVKAGRRNGETFYTDPRGGKRLRVNGRRKSAPRALTTRLNRSLMITQPKKQLIRSEVE